MFQEAALLPWLTARRNVELPLQLAGLGRRERRQRAEELLSLVRLDGQGDKRPHELSGGMRQRVSLARALAATTAAASHRTIGGGFARRRSSGQDWEAENRPGMLLMDEPFAALDAITRDVLQGELLRVWQATGTTILFVTHDVREAIRLAERVVLLSSRPGTVVRRVAGRRRADGDSTRRSPDACDRSSPAMPHDPTPLQADGRPHDATRGRRRPGGRRGRRRRARRARHADHHDAGLVAAGAGHRAAAARGDCCCSSRSGSSSGRRRSRTSSRCRPRSTSGRRSPRSSTTARSGRSSGPRSAGPSSASPSP